MEKILPDRLASKLILHIKLISLPDCIYGTTTPRIAGQKRSKEFLIELEKHMDGNMLRNMLFHELAHVRQYATGTLRDYVRTESLNWKGRKFAIKCEQSDEKYFLCDWEIEAFGLSHSLMELWLNR